MSDFVIPSGFRMSGVHCGIKSASMKNDLAMFLADQPVVASGVYTQNLVHATSIDWNRAITPSDDVRCLVMNSGNANACTGTQGEQDNQTMAKLAASCFDGHPKQTLVLSTGIIGEHLPMDRVGAGIQQAFDQLSENASAIDETAAAMMTTDATKKIAFREIEINKRKHRVLAMAKGAGMIGPNMATMLAVILTDVPMSVSQSDRMLRAAVDLSFNCISVEGHTSTNDAVIMFSSGLVESEPISPADELVFGETLNELSIELAKMIPSDGEGATHLIEIHVSGADSDGDADRVARSIANSALVKTAITGADPNWGRIVSAAGYAGVDFHAKEVVLRLNDVLLFKDENPVEFDESGLSSSMKDSATIKIDLCVGKGAGSKTHWTSNLTHDYIRINADYHT